MLSPTYAEGMAAGLPIVSRPVGGIPSEYNMKYAEERFEIRRVVKRIEKIYLDIIGSK